MKRILVGSLLVLGLAGCGTDVATQGGIDGEYDYVDVSRPGGGTVPCIIYDGIRAGGISCDWNVEQKKP